MREEKITGSRKKNFFAKNGFFIALGVGLLAVGAAVFGVIGSGNDKISMDGNAEQVTIPVTTEYVTSAAVTAAAVTTEPPTVTEPVTEEPAPKYRMPSGGTVVKPFSDGELVESKTFGDYRIHNGIDIESPKGSAVYSASNGSVEKLYEDDLWGNVMIVDAGNGIKCYYFGLTGESEVTEGQEVQTGDQIGTLGDIPCEAADSAHLHFGVTKDGKWCNPLMALGLS